MSYATTTVTATLLSQGDCTPAEPLAPIESLFLPSSIPQTNDPLLGTMIILAILCTCALMGICIAYYRLTTTRQSQIVRCYSLNPHEHIHPNRLKHRTSRFKKSLSIVGIVTIQIAILIGIYLAIT